MVSYDTTQVKSKNGVYHPFLRTASASYGIVDNEHQGVEEFLGTKIDNRESDKLLIGRVRSIAPPCEHKL